MDHRSGLIELTAIRIALVVPEGPDLIRCFCFLNPLITRQMRTTDGADKMALEWDF